MKDFENDQKKLMFLRKKINRRTLIILFITLFVIVTIVKNIIDYCIKNQTSNEFIIVFTLLILTFSICGIAIVIDSKINKKINNEYFSIYKKIHTEYKLLVLKCFKDVFKNVEYDEERGLSFDEVYSTELIRMGDRFQSNDYLSAQYNGVQFRFSDVYTEEKVEEKDKDGRTRTHYETLFRGQLYEFEFNKQFKSAVKVYETLSNSLINYKTNRILLEDIDFNNNFIVYADNELDAFYVLTPNIMEKIKELSIKISSGVSFGFIDNKLYIAVDSYKDMFELNIYSKFNLEEEIKKINDNIKIICDFVDELNLDNTLFRREV